MRQVPVGGASIRRAQAWAMLAGVLLTACDVSPLLVDQDRAFGTAERTRVPVETVTAIEVDAEDLRVPAPPESRPAESLR